ncbi:hypothetical protein LAZ67_3005154 [Cordylochernes scorpioides]|uniref:Reverse transcriptase n=1 Tax=Cordylochernes scorpioides TaxID=51811 RepID=A0ABY6KA18_9ARAC|nr:hypothetical protein LAZ67_3005154 [Cordylochernes scorpioides]
MTVALVHLSVISRTQVQLYEGRAGAISGLRSVCHSDRLVSRKLAEGIGGEEGFDNVLIHGFRLHVEEADSWEELPQFPDFQALELVVQGELTAGMASRVLECSTRFPLVRRDAQTPWGRVWAAQTALRMPYGNKEKQPPIAFIAEQREEYDKRSSVTFIVDSGSTCHMINGEKLLDHQKKCDVNINVAKKKKPRYREDLDSEIEESQDTKMELDTHDKPQNSTNSKYMLRNRENINRPERLKDYEVLNSVPEEIGLLTYNEAVTGVDKEKWVKAIQEEKDSLKKNETWDFVNAEEVKGKKILSSRWIFKIKDGGHYKARLVARGNEQKGLDFDETFSPVVSTISLRMLLSLSVKKNLKFKTFDVKTAFLYGYLDEEIFMYLPEGYEDNKICRLKKALYGLRQAPSKWNKRFEAFLKTKGLVQSKLENCIFKNQNGSLILALYVDDGMLFGSHVEEMDNLLEELAQEFEIRISNNPEMYVGMNIMNKDEGLILSQHDYIECVLKKYMFDTKPVTTPIVEGAVKIDPILENKSEGPEPHEHLQDGMLQELTTDQEVCERDYTNPGVEAGKYRFKRLPFGISSAPEVFQRKMSNLLESQSGVNCHMDDIVIWGATQEEHDERLRCVLRKLQDSGLTLNKEKCIFSVKEIKFLGQLITERGVLPDPNKVQAIREFPSPSSISEVRRFLGMVNFTVKRNDRRWDSAQEEAFEKVKKLLSTSPTLTLFDPNLPRRWKSKILYSQLSKRNFRKNRFHLLPNPQGEKIDMEDEEMEFPEMSQCITSTGDNTTCDSEPRTFQRSPEPVKTRSGRVIKPPDRLNL